MVAFTRSFIRLIVATPAILAIPAILATRGTRGTEGIRSYLLELKIFKVSVRMENDF